jgi:hypothetical protein
MKRDNFDNCNKQKMVINVDPRIIIKVKRKW